MSQGNPIIKLRVSRECLEKINSAIASANVNRKLAPYDLSSWIRAAIDDKLKHLSRSRSKKGE